MRVTRDGPEWIVQGGSEMLCPLGLRVQSSEPARLQGGGQFLVDDGCRHAYALHVGEYTIISFRSGSAELLLCADLCLLRDQIRSGMSKLFRIVRSDPYRPFAAGGWTPPWSRSRMPDSLCGARKGLAQATRKKPASSLAMKRQVNVGAISKEGDVKTYETKRDTCVCGHDLRAHHCIDAVVYGMEGPVKVKVQTWRCNARDCGTTYGPNFFAENHQKINTARLSDLDGVLFISNKKGRPYLNVTGDLGNLILKIRKQCLLSRVHFKN